MVLQSQIIVIPQSLFNPTKMTDKKIAPNTLKRKLTTDNVVSVKLSDNATTTVVSVNDDSPGRKRANLDHLSPEEKLQRRKLKNRVAAQNARDKKRVRMDGMEEAIKKMENETKRLLQENKRLQELNQRLINENKSLKQGQHLLPPSPLDSLPMSPTCSISSYACSEDSSDLHFDQTFVVSTPAGPAESCDLQPKGPGVELAESVWTERMWQMPRDSAWQMPRMPLKKRGVVT